MVVLEDWEGTDIATSYRGDVAQFQTQSTVVAEGATSLEGINPDSGGYMIFADNPATTIEHDKTYRVYNRLQSAAYPGIAWFVDPASTSENDWSGYLLQMGRASADDLRLFRASNGGYTLLHQPATTTNADTWYQLEFTHHSNNIIEYSHLDVDGNVISSHSYDASADATIYSSGDFGFYTYASTAGHNSFHDGLRSLEPDPIAGMVTLNGVSVEGAKLTAIDQQAGDTIGTAFSAADGSYSIPTDRTTTALVKVEHEAADGTKYQDISNSSIQVGGPVGTPYRWWPISEGTGTITTDRVASDDASIVGASWLDNATEAWMHEWALDGNGVDNYVSTGTWGTFGSSMLNDFAIGFTFRTAATARYSRLARVNNSANSMGMNLNMNTTAGSGNIRMQIWDANGSNTSVASVEDAANSGFNDDVKHRLVYNKTGNTASGFNIWVDGTQLTTTADADQGILAVTDFDQPIPFMCRNTAGTISEFTDMTLDNIVVWGHSLTPRQIAEDYDQQLWTP